MDRARRQLALRFAVAVGLVPSIAAAFPVTVDPGAYAGRYVAAGQLAGGVTTIDLAPGSYTFDDGFSLSGSAFFFTVDGAGQVQSQNAAAAQGVGATLQLNTTTITVDGGAYPYDYFPVAGTLASQSGVAGVVVIPGLVHAIDNGTFLGGSGFFYLVDGAGQVSCSTPSALCSGTTVALQVATVTVDPGSYTGGYALTATTHTLYSGLHSFALIAGTVYGIDDGNFIGGSEFAFQVQPDGSVTSLAPASATGGPSLRFVTVPVHVDAGGYPGTYRVGSEGPFAGATDTSMISNLVVVVALDNGLGAAITPGPGGIVPATLAFVVGPQTFTFNLGLTAGFTPPGGNVSVASGPVDITFSSVTTSGITTVTSTTTAPRPPVGFRLGQVRTYYDVTTTATFGGTIQVCVSYAGLGVTRPTRLKLFHFQGGAWVNVTSSNDTTNQIICGSVTSLSPFGIFEPTDGKDHDGDDHDHDGDDHGHHGDDHDHDGDDHGHQGDDHDHDGDDHGHCGR